MLTFQDLEKLGTDESKRIDFVKSCITEKKSGADYKQAQNFRLYYLGENPKIARAQKIIYDMQGIAHLDEVTPNHKIYSRYVFSAITEGTQYLLGNGVTFDDDAVKRKLGADIDTKLQQLADDCQTYGVGWGYWTGEKLAILPYLEFFPLYDEYDSSVKAGVRFWQIDTDKPLRAVLYEVDGYTEYIQENGEEMRVDKPKRRYPAVKIVNQTFGTEEITNFQNYPALPIIPLYYINKKSIMWGNTPAIDAYDLLLSKMVNNIDEGNLVYWVLSNCNGMSETDDANFIARIIKNHVVKVDGDDGANAVPHQIEAPITSTETGIERVRRLLDDNFMTCDTESIRSGNVTATQIKAAYQKLDAKTSKFEYNVIEFIQRLLFVTGLDKNARFTFKWDKTINKQEEVQTVLQAAAYLDEDTVTKMLLEALGKTDLIDEVTQRKQETALQRFNLAQETQTEPETGV